MFSRIPIYALVLLLSSCSKTDTKPPAVNEGDEVVIKDGGYACVYPGRLAKALEHEHRKEIEALVSTINDEPYCVSNVSGDLGGQRWTVLYVRDDIAAVGITDPAQMQQDLERNNSRYKHEYLVPTNRLSPATPIASSSASGPQ